MDRAERVLATPRRARRPRRSVFAALIACALLALAGAPSQAAAPTTAGQIYAFGENYSGQLGNATHDKELTANPSPALVTLPGVSGSVIEVAAGEEHTLAVTSGGQLYAFGSNFYGQLGISTDSGSSTPDPTPTLVSLPGATGPVTQVAAGYEHSLAVTSTGQLYAFGSNFYGQLGVSTNSGSTTANSTPTLVSLPGATGPVTEVAAGSEHSLAATSTGQLYAFGENEQGQLGSSTHDNTHDANPTPTLVTLPGAGGPVVQLAGGGAHSLALTSTGQLYAFGENRGGQLGVTTHSGTGEPTPTPTLVTLPGATGPITEIAAGNVHTVVATATGQLYAFGENHFGQLGDTAGNGAAVADPTPTLVTLPGATGGVTQIAAGSADSLAVTSSGQLYAFGENRYGQLGNATTNGEAAANPTPTLVALPAGTTIDTLARGPSAQHTLAVVADLAVASSSLPGGEVGVPYAASPQVAGGAAPYTWSASGLPAGLSIDAATGQISGRPTATGSANVTLTVRDADGIVATSAVIPLAITRPAFCACGAVLIPPPEITAASLTNKRFRVGGHATAVSARKVPVGTIFRFTLSAAAKLRIAITRTAAGLRHGHSCLAPSAKLRRKHAKSCTRTLTVGTLTRASEPRATDSVAFSGRIGRHALGPRSYVAVLTASDSAGHSKPVSLSFTVVR
jgi:alpha-tubulin suppressor-like RCC1 family protein